MTITPPMVVSELNHGIYQIGLVPQIIGLVGVGGTTEKDYEIALMVLFNPNVFH